MFPLKCFSIEHRETKTKAIITANQKITQGANENVVKYTKHASSAGNASLHLVM